MESYQFIFLSGIVGVMSSIGAAKLTGINRALLAIGLASGLTGLALFFGSLLWPQVLIGLLVFVAIFWLLSSWRGKQAHNTD